MDVAETQPLVTGRPAPEAGAARRVRAGRPALRLRLRRLAGFAAALGLTLLLALDGGGYDIVIRQEEGLGIWGLIALGLAVGILPRARLTPATWVALGGFAAFASLNALALSWTGSDERTTAE